jgi:rod shape determining protein RodA
MSHTQPIMKKGINWTIVVLYVALVFIGLISIFQVEYRPQMDLIESWTGLQTNYSKQLLYFSICLVMGIFILLTDSKFFSATANLFYVLGIILLLATFVFGKNVAGSRSWIPLGFMNLQPAETCKIFVALALGKYLGKLDTDFRQTRSQMIALALALTPAVFSILQNETGLALVYFAFFLPLYREGLPAVYLVSGISAAFLTVAAILMEPDTFLIILSIIAVLAILLLKSKIRRQKSILLLIVMIWGAGIGLQRVGVPFIFEDMFQPYQTERIMSMFGKDYIPTDTSKIEAFERAKEMQGKVKDGEKQENYNVKQSKIAIGSGGFWGKGFLKGTVTQGQFVPEQHTDFIFTAIGETFGFWGSALVALLYFALLMIIIVVAERQRSVFSRVYAYSVAAVIFFHVVVNMLMTMGLAPIIGIPLPLLSYGGSSLLTFTVLIFILIRLDADRQVVIR